MVIYIVCFGTSGKGNLLRDVHGGISYPLHMIRRKVFGFFVFRAFRFLKKDRRH